MRIKLGLKAWATLSAMLLSVAVISGCNEDASTPAPGGTGGPAAGKGPEGGKMVPPPPPSPPKTDADKKP